MHNLSVIKKRIQGMSLEDIALGKHLVATQAQVRQSKEVALPAARAAQIESGYWRKKWSQADKETK